MREKKLGRVRAQRERESVCVYVCVWERERWVWRKFHRKRNENWIITVVLYFFFLPKKIKFTFYFIFFPLFFSFWVLLDYWVWEMCGEHEKWTTRYLMNFIVFTTFYSMWIPRNLSFNHRCQIHKIIIERSNMILGQRQWPYTWALFFFSSRQKMIWVC